MLLTETPPPVDASNPIIVWVSMGTSALVILAAAAPKILGPIGKAWSDWLDERRRITATKESDTETGLREDLSYWKGVADERLRDILARDSLAQKHYAWDYERIQEAAEAGHPASPPPPLVPVRCVNDEIRRETS